MGRRRNRIDDIDFGLGVGVPASSGSAMAGEGSSGGAMRSAAAVPQGARVRHLQHQCTSDSIAVCHLLPFERLLVGLLAADASRSHPEATCKIGKAKRRKG